MTKPLLQTKLYQKNLSFSMKKKILFLLFILSNITATFSCDICSCGIGNNYIGILPDFNQRIVGIRSRYNEIKTHLGQNNSNTYLATQENYHTVEVWGGWTLFEKIRLMASAPYHLNKKTSAEKTEHRNGFGDVNVMAYYQLLNTKQTTFSTFLLVHSLWIGGGIKLPTGQYETPTQTLQNTSLNLFQLGTGSYDFNFSAMYDVRLQDAGINILGNYKLSSENSAAYQYGNKSSFNVQAYYKFNIKNQVKIMPNIGTQYETADTDTNKGLVVFSSGGNLFSTLVGVEVTFKKFALGGNFQLPLWQNIANETAKAGNKLMLHVAYMF